MSAWGLHNTLMRFDEYFNIDKSVFLRLHITGKSFSEALILASVNPQYDKRLFIEFPPKYTSLEQDVYKKCFFVFVLTFKTIFVHNMF